MMGRMGFPLSAASAALPLTLVLGLVPVLVPVLVPAPAAAQIRPVPPAARPATLQAPVLEILEVRRFIDADEPIQLNDRVPVEVVVRNTGNRTARVRAGAANPRAGRAGEPLMRFGPVREVAAGATATLPLELLATGNLFRGDRFEPTVFLFQPPGEDEPPMGRPFRDRTPDDNEYRASLSFERPRTFDVLATLERIRVLDDCDNVSEGDWILHVTLAELRGDVITRKVESYWPEERTPRDVDTGTTIAIDRILRLTGVRPDSRLLLTVAGVDCDSDTPLAWPLTMPVATLSEGPRSTSTGPAQAYMTLNGRCSGEEIWEASGKHDGLGVHQYVLEPAEWQRATRALRATSYVEDECSPSGPAFEPTLRVEASVR